MLRGNFMKEKSRVNDIFVICYSFLIFNIAFTSILPKVVVNAITLITFTITILLTIRTITFIFNDIIGLPFMLFLCYILLTVLSTHFNKGGFFSTGATSSTINYIMILITIFLGIIIISAFGKLKSFLLVIFFVELAYCLLNDITFLPNYRAFIASQAYLLNGKFQVAYAHLDLLALYFANIYAKSLKMKKEILYSLIILALIVNLLVNCITGIVGLLLFIIFYFFCSKKLLRQPLFWLVIFIICSSVPFVYQYIIDSTFYQNFVIGSLNRGLTMTGRMNIYKAVPYLMYNHWHWGYGYGTSYAVVNGLISMPNMQNGFMELVVQVGLITTTFFILFVLAVIKSVRFEKNIITLPFLCLVYVYTLLSSFEITFSITFFFICMIIYVLSRKGMERNDSLNG